MRAQSVKAYIRLSQWRYCFYLFPRLSQGWAESTEIKAGHWRRAESASGAWWERAYSASFFCLLPISSLHSPPLLNYQPKYPENKRSPAIKDEVDFPLLSPLRTLRPIGTLRSNDATATKTSPKKWICVLSVFIAIIPAHLLCQI